MVRPWLRSSDNALPNVAARTDVSSEHQARTDLDRAMLQMKPKERAMLWLAYAEGSSHHEIAAAVGVKPASVKLLLFRARRKIAALLSSGAREQGNSRL